MSSNSAPDQQEVPQASGFELEQLDLYGKYMLTGQIDILFVLRSIIKRGCMATVYFNHGRSFFLTWLLAIAADEKHIVLDIASNEAINREALKATRLVITTNLDNVKIQFALDGLKEASFEGRPAFLAPVPEALLRLQRREYFRLETPPGNPVTCQVAVKANSAAPHALDLVLLDISGGGLSLMVPSEIGELFKTGALYPDCRLQIPNENVITATLCVRSAFDVASRSGQTYVRVGCEFISLPGTRLTMIQRYITRVERERKARLSGLE